MNWMATRDYNNVRGRGSCVCARVCYGYVCVCVRVCVCVLACAFARV